MEHSTKQGEQTSPQKSLLFNGDSSYRGFRQPGSHWWPFKELGF